MHWWCVYYNQPTSTPLNQRFWNFVRSSCPVNPDGVRWWHWLWSACSISSFHLVHLSGKRRSELALTWYYNTTSAEKGWFVNNQWEFKIFSSSDCMMKIQIQMLKNRICPGNKPRLFWVTFKLMIFQNFENFHFSENFKNFVKSTWSSSQSFQACSFYCLHFEFRPSHWSICWPLDGNISFWGNKRSSSLFFHFVRKSPNSADLPCWPF